MIYALSLGAQESEIEALCYGGCGKFSVGLLKIEGGLFLACHENNCEHEEKRSEELGCFNGERVYARKLMKEVLDGLR